MIDSKNLKFLTLFLTVAFFLIAAVRAWAVGDVNLDSNLGTINSYGPAKGHLAWSVDEENKLIRISLVVNQGKGKKEKTEIYRFVTPKTNIEENQIGPMSYLMKTKDALDPITDDGFKMHVVRSETTWSEQGVSTDDFYLTVVQKAILYRDDAQKSVQLGELREEFTAFLYSELPWQLRSQMPINRPWKHGDGIPRQR